jgi:hypothetical protein
MANGLLLLVAALAMLLVARLAAKAVPIARARGVLVL